MKIEILGIDRTSAIEAGSPSITRISKQRRTCSITLFAPASSWIAGIGQDIKIYDDDLNLIFGGNIKNLGTEQLSAGDGNLINVLTRIYSDGYNHVAGRRASVAGYSTSYAGVIVEDLRADILNKAGESEGIGAGNIENGAYYERFNKPITTVKDLYDDLAKASGFKWYIDDSKDLYFEADSSTPDAAHEIMSTGSFKDFHSFRVTQQLDEYRNRQVVVGGADADSGLMIQVEVDSTAQIAAQQALEGGSSYSSGIYVNVINDANIHNTADAIIVANNALKQYGYPEGISFRSYQTDWQPSTKLKVKLPKYGIDDISYYLVEEVTIERMNANTFISTVVATKRSSGNFSSQKTPDDVDFMSDLVRATKEDDVYKVDVYAQEDEPTNLPANRLWVDIDDMTRYDKIALTDDVVLVTTDHEFLTASGTFDVTLHTAEVEGIIKDIYNNGTGIITLIGVVNGSTGGMLLYPNEGVHLITDGTEWRY